MKNRDIGIGAILVSLTIGFAIGVVIGVVISGRVINQTSVREEKTVAYQQQVQAPVGTPQTRTLSPNAFDVKTAKNLHNDVRTKVEPYVVTVKKHFDHAKGLHVSRQLKQVNTVKRSGQFDQAKVPDARAAAHPGATPEFNRAGDHAG